MKKTCALAAVPLALFLAHCRPKSVEDRIAALPELPAEIADTLDPETLATRIVANPSLPATATAPAAAPIPCCTVSEKRHLTVRFRYTKCTAPVGDFDPEGVLTEGGLGGARPTLHRLTELRGRTLSPVRFCFTRSGPWNAVFTELRACSPATPHRTLAIAALGDVVHYEWAGLQPAPANVLVLSCRTEGIERSLCPGASLDCKCLSAPCTAPAACSCPLELPSGDS